MRFAAVLFVSRLDSPRCGMLTIVEEIPPQLSCSHPMPSHRASPLQFGLGRLEGESLLTSHWPGPRNIRDLDQISFLGKVIAKLVYGLPQRVAPLSLRNDVTAPRDAGSSLSARLALSACRAFERAADRQPSGTPRSTPSAPPAPLVSVRSPGSTASTASTRIHIE